MDEQDAQYLINIWEGKELKDTQIVTWEELWEWVDKARADSLQIAVFKITVGDCLLDWS